LMRYQRIRLVHASPEVTHGTGRSDGDVTFWIPKQVLRECLHEANEKHPLETGGTFMGWRSTADAFVITAMIGPGPGAYHARYQFEPDQTWQLLEIAGRYESSGRRETYLGDWHTHPNAVRGALSLTDRGVLRRIINTPAARCPAPLMVLMWGSPSMWSLTAWQARAKRRVLLWDKVELESVQLKLF
jgi:integrative and conjugative element protein (TIGR02256 family)